MGIFFVNERFKDFHRFHFMFPKTKMTLKKTDRVDVGATRGFFGDLTALVVTEVGECKRSVFLPQKKSLGI